MKIIAGLFLGFLTFALVMNMLWVYRGPEDFVNILSTFRLHEVKRRITNKRYLLLFSTCVHVMELRRSLFDCWKIVFESTMERCKKICQTGLVRQELDPRERVACALLVAASICEWNTR